MPNIVECPHCGAPNPYSLLVTICQQCKGDLAGAEPVEAPAVERPTERRPAGETAGPEAAVPVRGAAEAPAIGVEQPPAVPSAPPEARADARIVCGRCGYTNRPGAASCARCGAAVQAGDTAMAVGPRPCPRCGHRQDAQRASCEKCGMHFIGPALQATAALGRQPLRRAPKSLGEDATKGCAIAAGCVIALVMAIVVWVMLALGTMR